MPHIHDTPTHKKKSFVVKSVFLNLKSHNEHKVWCDPKAARLKPWEGRWSRGIIVLTINCNLSETFSVLLSKNL